MMPQRGFTCTLLIPSWLYLYRIFHCDYVLAFCILLLLMAAYRAVVLPLPVGACNQDNSIGTLKHALEKLKLFLCEVQLKRSGMSRLLSRILMATFSPFMVGEEVERRKSILWPSTCRKEPAVLGGAFFSAISKLAITFSLEIRGAR